MKTLFLVQNKWNAPLVLTQLDCLRAAAVGERVKKFDNQQ